MNLLLHPTYFFNIAQWSNLLKHDCIVFEIHDSYQKQTYRNRTYIYGSNGILALTIPVIYSQSNRQFYKDIKIYNLEKWQALHWKSLLSAYGTSPYFEFYKDEIAPLFHSEQVYLMDFNFKCFKVILECLQLPLSYQKTDHYDKAPLNTKDIRYLANVTKEKTNIFSKYTQVFNHKHGFISNLSILDLIFNEGPNSINYLKEQTT